MANRRGAGGARRVALVAMLTALSLVLLYLSALAPTGRMGVVAVAGLLPAVAVVSSGISSGFFCYAATGILSLLLVPDKGNALLYLLLFGLYPMVKCLIERLKSLPLELVCKLVFFNGVLSIFWFGLREVFLAALPKVPSQLWLLYAAGSVIFLIYDFGFSKLITFYTQRIHKAISHV